MYNPYAAVGSRYSEWADSKIPRLYHSVAFLLLDATVSASQIMVQNSARHRSLHVPGRTLFDFTVLSQMHLAW